jgi:glycosyltransferase involved in cell wall biosynthesis
MNLLFLNTYCGYFGGVEQNILAAVSGLRAMGHRCTLVYQKETENRLEDYQDAFDDTICAPTSKELTATLTRLIDEQRWDSLFVHKIESVLPLRPLKGTIRMVRMFHDHDECCPRRHKYFVCPSRICKFSAGFKCWADLAFIEKNGKGPLGVGFKNLFRHKKELVANSELFDLCLVGSRFMQSELEMNGFDPDRITRIAPCVRLAPRSPVPLPDNHKILYVGQLTRGKGVDLLLQALTHVTESYHLTIAGAGNAEESLKDLAQKLDMDAHVTFAGWVNPEELDQLYDQCRILAVPSRWAEPFGMIGLEAMQRARPVVAFAVGGIPDWLETGVTGYTAPEANVQELADGLNRLLYDYKTAVTFGRQGRKKLEEEFSFDSYLQKLCGVLGQTQHEDPKEEA